MSNQTSSIHKDALDLFKGLFFNVLGMVLKSGKVVFIFIAAHYYNPTALGLYFLAWGTVDISSKLGLWGSDKNLIREIARLKSVKENADPQQIMDIIFYNVRLSLVLSVLVTGIIFLTSPIISEKIFQDSALIAPMRILALAIPFIVLTLVLISTTKALRLMQYETFIRQGLEPAMLLISALILIPFHLGATGLAIAHLIASLGAAIASLVVVFKKFYFPGWRPLPLPAKVKSQTWRYTTPIAATDFVNLAVARIDTMLVGALLNSTMAGYYGIAIEIISVIKRVRQSFEPIFAPIVSELFHSGESKRLQRNYQLVTRWLMAGSFLPVIAIFLFPQQILTFFNIQSPQAASALRILALAHGLFGAFSAAESLLLMSGKSLLNFILGSLMMIISLLMGLFLIPKLGLLGAALATLSSFFFVSMARVYHGYRSLRILPFGSILLWPIVSGSVTFFLFYLIKNWVNTTSFYDTGMMFLGLLIVYAGLYFGGANESEEKFLRERIMNNIRRRFFLVFNRSV